MPPCLGPQFWKQLTCSEPQEIPRIQLGRRQLIPACFPFQVSNVSLVPKNKQKSQQGQGKEGGCKRGPLKRRANSQTRHKPTRLTNSWSSFHKLEGHADTVAASSLPYFAQHLFVTLLLVH